MNTSVGTSMTSIAERHRDWRAASFTPASRRRRLSGRSATRAAVRDCRDSMWPCYPEADGTCRAALRCWAASENGVMGPKARRTAPRGWGGGSPSVHCHELGRFRPGVVAHGEASSQARPVPQSRAGRRCLPGGEDLIAMTKLVIAIRSIVSRVRRVRALQGGRSSPEGNNSSERSSPGARRASKHTLPDHGSVFRRRLRARTCQRGNAPTWSPPAAPA